MQVDKPKFTAEISNKTQVANGHGDGPRRLWRKSKAQCALRQFLARF